MIICDRNKASYSQLAAVFLWLLQSIWIFVAISPAFAQTGQSFQDAYGNMLGRGNRSKITDKNYYINQQSNMADRSNVNAGVNPRGNVDVNPPGFVGDNPFGNSTTPNP